jgi:uncharacterized protein (DUF697 family)
MAQEHTSVFGSLKGILAGELDRASADEKSQAVTELIRRASSQSALLVLEPIPLIDTGILLLAQHRLVESIAHLRGHRLDKKQVDEAFDIIRGHLITPNLIIVAAKLIAFIPIVPEAWSGTVAYALTAAIGELADAYFRGGRTMSPDDIRAKFDQLFTEIWRKVRQVKRNELRALFRNKHVRHAMRDLKRTYRAGKMNAEEVLRRSQEILERHH